MSRRRRHDLYDIAVSELVFERHDAAVGFRAHAGQADLRVYEEGEIYGRGPSRQLYDFSLGREAVDLFGVEVELERIEEFARVLDLLLPLDEALEPHEGLVLIRVRAAPAFLVLPVRGDAFLGYVVHIFGS